MDKKFEKKGAHFFRFSMLALALGCTTPLKLRNQKEIGNWLEIAGISGREVLKTGAWRLPAPFLYSKKRKIIKCEKFSDLQKISQQNCEMRSLF